MTCLKIPKTYIIRSRKSKKDKQFNVENKKDKMTNNDIQNTTHKTKDRATRIQIKTGVNSGVAEGSAVSTPLVVPVVLLLLRAL